MFSYDSQLTAALAAKPQTIAEVLQLMQAIDTICAEGDGLAWFNRLYMQVTAAVERGVAVGGFQEAAWLAEPDVQFAGLSFRALGDHLAGGKCPGCWSALFDVRSDVRIAHIQFAMAGINAHINHDLPEALVHTALAMDTVPGMGRGNTWTSRT